MSDKNNLHAMRHSLAHIMATAIQAKWPKAMFGVGPVVENGFYYDVDLGETTLSEDDLAELEIAMKKVIEEGQSFDKSEMAVDDAINWAKENDQPYKLELLNDLKRSGTTAAKDIDSEELGVESREDSKVENVSFYTNGPFTDLCRGPHVANTNQVGVFKLTGVSGAYWRGNAENPQMQRIYGVAFETQEELEHYLEMLEKAKTSDHRILGDQLGIFTTNEDVGKGFPLLLPRGATIKTLLGRYMRQLEESEGYQYVDTPIIANEKLYQQSGHAQFYADDMFSITDSEGQKFYLSPMNCPHHHKLYEKLVYSYNDLPLKLAEQSGLYRHELSGTLTGLIRVRGPITQNDAHIYVTQDQLKTEFIKVLKMFKEVYEVFGIDDYWFRLSLPDFNKDKFEGNQEEWEKAGNTIKEALQEFGAEFVEAEGEAAFYGPKVDIQTRNVLGKEDSIATSQIDLLVPSRMDLKYIDSDSKEQTPLVIHRAILGSIERFIGFYIEKTAGHLPFWLAPEQVRVLTINDSVKDYVAQITDILKSSLLMKPLKYNEIRYSVDDRNESLGRKIRDAAGMKIPVTLIVGPKDVEASEVSVRTQEGEQKIQLNKLKDFIESL